MLEIQLNSDDRLFKPHDQIHHHLLLHKILNLAANPQQFQLQNFRHGFEEEEREEEKEHTLNFFCGPDLNSSLVL